MFSTAGLSIYIQGFYFLRRVRLSIGAKKGSINFGENFALAHKGRVTLTETSMIA